jgi:homogentisate 1,2-dioxygenase
MLDRVAVGDLPAKHHLALYGAQGSMRYEECLTRLGFDGPYTILYHEHRPHAFEAVPSAYRCHSLRADDFQPLRRHHYRTHALAGGGMAIAARVPLLFNEDLTISRVQVNASDAAYFVNADADELFFVRSGGGKLRSVFGDLEFAAGDYLCVPKATLYRVMIDAPDCEMLLIECQRLGLLEQWRNEVGQIRMDAPYCHRDFRRPAFRGPLDEGIRDLIVQRERRYHGFRYAHSPLDVVGWDGSVYPWTFPILAFQPRVSSVHLPPTWHGTFSARGALVCSFVPRPLDFHPQAVPCPYPHSSVDVDEVLYYVSGEFASRTGVEPGSLTLHPRGIPHGPQPGRYEASQAVRRTEEVAVMLDCYAPLCATEYARKVEDERYEASFLGS